MDRRFSRVACATFAVAAILFAAEPVVSAHGGSHGGYTPPPPPVPPAPPQPPPAPPSPPPHPPPTPLPNTPSTPTVPPTPTTTGESQGAPSTPESTPASPTGRPRGALTRGSGSHPTRAGKGAARTADSTDWQDWWNANAGALRATRPERARVTTESTFAGVGAGASTGAYPDVALRRSIDTLLIPTLRAVLSSAGHNDTDTIASSTIALAKASDDPADALRIVAVLNDPHLSDMDHEAAAMALGCLRRTTAPPAFDGRFYDQVRATLCATLDDRRQTHRTRCFAAMALGILGDQPTDDADVFAKDGRLVIRDLWLRLERAETDDDSAVAMLVALSLQNPRGVPSAVRVGLRRLAQAGDSGRRRRGALPRAHALLALARLGDGDGVGLATAIVKSNNENAHLRRSALLALGLLSPRMETSDRESVAKLLLTLAKGGEPNTAGLALISAARLLSAEFAQGRASDPVIASVESLVDIADRGAFDVRPFAALAVGIASRPAGKALASRAFVEVRSKALEKLRRIYADDGQDPELRGAFAVALGIAADTEARVILEATVASKRGSPEVAAYACAGLGLLADVPASTLAALRAALVDRSSEMLQHEAARALGLLGDTRAVPMLVAQVEHGGSDSALARAIVALGSIRDVSSIAPLCTLARRSTTSDLARALACAGLGLLADFERTPSLSLLGIDSNYLARTEALNDALSLL